MMIFVGLGNHELKYHNTKHNVGYWVLDGFAKQHGLEFKPGKGNYFVAKKGSSFMLIKPTTGMNNSGTIINEVLNFYKAKKEDLVIVFDDVDLPLGEIRFKTDGGDGCHNGMKSIIKYLSTNNIKRLKVGIAASDYKRPSEKYVLKPFHSRYNALIEDVLSFSSEAMTSLLENGEEFTMNNFNNQTIGVA